MQLLKRIIEKLNKSRFEDNEKKSKGIFRNMLLLASGTATAQLVAFITLPIITRIYSPQDLGTLSVFTAVLSVLAPLTTLKYSNAVPLPKTDAIAINLLVICIFSSVITSCLSFVVLIFYRHEVFSFLSAMAVVPYWWLFPIALLGIGLYETLVAWATRKKAFKQVSISRVVQSVLGALVKIVLGIFGLKPLGLLFGSVASQVSALGGLFAQLKKDFEMTVYRFRYSHIKYTARRYLDFPLYRLPSQLLLIVSAQAPIIFTAIHFGTATAGQLGLAIGIVGVPMGLVGTSTAQAYYAEIARIGKGQAAEVKEVSIQVMKRLCLLSVIPFLVLFFLAADGFVLAFGDAWREAGFFCQILSVYLLVQFISSPFVNVLSVFEKQWMYLRINVVRLLIVFSIFMMPYFFDLAVNSLITFYSVGLSIHYLVTLFLVFRVIEQHS